MFSQCRAQRIGSLLYVDDIRVAQSYVWNSAGMPGDSPSYLGCQV